MTIEERELILKIKSLENQYGNKTKSDQQLNEEINEIKIKLGLKDPLVIPVIPLPVIIGKDFIDLHYSYAVKSKSFKAIASRRELIIAHTDMYPEFLSYSHNKLYDLDLRKALLIRIYNELKRLRRLGLMQEYNQLKEGSL